MIRKAYYDGNQGNISEDEKIEERQKIMVKSEKISYQTIIDGFRGI